MDRYSRQKLVKQIGQQGQKKISQATVLIVGVGALGSYAAALLARAGVSHLILIDPDVVSWSNLQRQALFTEQDVKVEQLKVVAAKRHLQAINSGVEVTAIPSPLSPDIVDQYNFDLCLDCLDNYTGRDLLNRLAIKHNFDYIFASCAGTFGNVMPISPREDPCLNCLFPNLTQLKQTDCDLIGVNTALIPIVAGLQTSLALHYLVDRSAIDFHQLTTVDNWRLTLNHYHIAKNPHCLTCQLAPDKVLSTSQEPTLRMLCGEGAFYTTLSNTGNLKQWQRWLSQRNQPAEANKMFIHFTWQGKPVSLFSNGRLIMYHLDDTTAAEKQLTAIRQLAHEISKEGS